MIADTLLTPHFSLYEMTKTDNAALQEQNRTLTPDQIIVLTALANLLEIARTAIGNLPIQTDDGYRCSALNQVDGGVPNSQHQLCQAVDWIQEGLAGHDDVWRIFQLLWQDFKQNAVDFGQMIFEEHPDSGTAWIHLSLGTPYRDPAKCGEVLHMINNQYTLLEQLPVA